jgi:pyruvate formate lyase activating enzyme
MGEEASTGVVIQMQDYSIHDGDGVRTTIFLAGCGLRCQWCANPESWTKKARLAFYAHKCLQCHRCEPVCPQNLKPSSNEFDLSDCSLCGACVSACPEKALEIACSGTDVESVMQKICRDELFFRYTGGGVTFSGGEPFLQHQFLRHLMAGCEQLGVSVWVETCGFFNWKQCQDLMSGIEHVFFDIKHMDEQVHEQVTGQSNRTILDNARKMHELGVPMTIRVPLITEVNLDDDNLRATAEFIREYLSGSTIELLPYHELGKAKYMAFRMDDVFHSFTTPTPEQVAKAYSIFTDYQIQRYSD